MHALYTQLATAPPGPILFPETCQPPHPHFRHISGPWHCFQPRKPATAHRLGGPALPPSQAARAPGPLPSPHWGLVASVTQGHFVLCKVDQDGHQLHSSKKRNEKAGVGRVCLLFPFCSGYTRPFQMLLHRVGKERPGPKMGERGAHSPPRPAEPRVRRTGA